MPHGKKTVFKLANAAGVLQDISQKLTEVSFPRARDMGEMTGFQPAGDARTWVPGLNGASITIQGKWDATIDAQLNDLLNKDDVPSAFEYGPDGITAGRVKLAGNVWVENYEPSSPYSDAVTFSATLRVNGAVSRTTF
jgi:predicted secreted protein